MGAHIKALAQAQFRKDNLVVDIFLTLDQRLEGGDDLGHGHTRAGRRVDLREALLKQIGGVSYHNSPEQIAGGALKRKFECTASPRSEEHTSELQSRPHLVCRLLLEK